MKHFESKIYEVSAGGVPAASAKKHASLASLKAGPVEVQKGATKERGQYLRWVRNQSMLMDFYRACRCFFDFRKGGAVHIAIDSNNAGGDDAELGVLYSTAAEKACWVPPLVRASVWCEASRHT
eukprot:11184888-Lingulodinium_polyedra.AAC.1